MREVLLIGMGAGDPGFMTVEAVDALRAADVLFVLEKREEVADLVALRRAILDRFTGGDGPRVVVAEDPPRGRGATAAEQRSAVAAWRQERAAVVAGLLRDELAEDGVGAFLVWGDPALYDSMLGVLEAVEGVPFEHRVLPGVSAVAALTARHRIPLHRPGGAVTITTGRRLAAGGFPAGTDDVVVLLDPDLALLELDPTGIDVFWGAYLGTPDELLVSGALGEVGEEIRRVRSAARRRKGWMFDTYLLRRRP